MLRKQVILVALEDRYGTSRVPELFHRAGAKVTLLGNLAAATAWSRFIDAKVHCPPDPSSLSTAIRRQLAKFDFPKPWVILADERSVQSVAASRGEPWLDEVFPVDHRSDAFDLIMHKSRFATAAQEAQLPMSPTQICHTLDEAVLASREIGFPLFLKGDVGFAGGCVVQVRNPSQLPDAFARVAKVAPILVQKAVVGTLGKTDVLFDHGKPVCWAHCHVYKTWPGQFGPSAVRRYIHDPLLDPLVSRLGRLTGFHGLCGYDWIRESSTGKIALLEFNARFTPAYHLAKAAGIDFSQGMAAMFSGKEFQTPALRHRDLPDLHMFPQDVKRCLDDRDAAGLLNWLTGSNLNDIPWNDLGLLAYHTLDLGGRAFSWFIRRLMPSHYARNNASLDADLFHHGTRPATF